MLVFVVVRFGHAEVALRDFHSRRPDFFLISCQRIDRSSFASASTADATSLSVADRQSSALWIFAVPRNAFAIRLNEAARASCCLLCLFFGIGFTRYKSAHPTR